MIVLTPPKQCARTMNTVRLCFAATIAFIVFAIDWSAADAVVCCNSSSVASGTGVAFCQNKNRTFHTVEAIGGGTCDDNQTALPVRKCCPPGQPYDPEFRFCGPAGADDDEYLRRMMQRLRDGFRVVADAVVVGYDYKQPKCDYTQLLVDVSAVEVRGMMGAHMSAIELPPGYCFDITPSDKLVARTCRPRDEYCGRDGYTCVNKCCESDQMYVIDDDGQMCKQSEKPFEMSAYETDADGRPLGLSNSTVLPYNVEPRCFMKQMVKDEFMLTTDGSLYLTGDHQRVPDVLYCVEYYAETSAQVAAVLQVFVCEDDTSYSWFELFLVACSMASAVCVALTLIFYNTLPSLQNSRNYYVKPYLAFELVAFLSSVIGEIPNVLPGYTCVLYGYFQLFTNLGSFCWLNVICYDIYWMLRNKISINRNTSTSVRTIMYYIYSWGFSSVIVSIGYLFQYSQHETLRKLSPDIGEPFCWFKEKTRYGILIFFLIPSSVILTANLIICFLTAIYFLRIKSDLNGFNGSDSKTESFLVYKEKFLMSIKLFLLMGTSYFFWIICGLFKNEEGVIFEISSLMTSLQGVTIFIIFVAKRNVIMDLRKTFRRSMDHCSKSTQINTISGSS